MFGLGVLKGLGITLKNFVGTYVDDLKSLPQAEAFAKRQGPEQHGGVFTVQYPEEKLTPPENFRFIPFLVTDYDVSKEAADYDLTEAKAQNRCTSCGICAKVCPPQCIWIVRTNDPKTGKPIPQPAEFYIDTDICMNCGYCAEFCPFDAIKMDNDYELADYHRAAGEHIHNLERLIQPVSHYANIRPTWYALELAAKEAEAEEKRRKEELKQQKAAEKEAAAKAAAAKAAESATAKTGEAGEAKGKRTPEEIKAQREAMMAKKAAKAAGLPEPAAEAPAEKPKRSPEEIKAQRDAMMAKRAAKAAGLPEPEVPVAAEPPAKPKRTPAEIKAQREAMLAKRAGLTPPEPSGDDTE